MNTTQKIATITPINPLELLMFIKDAELIRRMMNTHRPRKITARQMSRELGFASHSYMNRILNGEVRSVTPDTAMKIAFLLGCPVDVLFDAKASGNAGRNVRGVA